jgi:hypothetical protein
MNYLAVALVAIVICAADFGSHWLDFSSGQQKGWSSASSLVLIYSAFYFWKAFDKGSETSKIEEKVVNWYLSRKHAEKN